MHVLGCGNEDGAVLAINRAGNASLWIGGFHIIKDDRRATLRLVGDVLRERRAN